MQNASMTLAPIPASNTSHCRIVTSQNDDSFSEANPVNLAAYANRMQRSDVDILHYPTDMASYSGYSQNNESPTKFNCPIDLAVSAPRDHSQRSDLLNSNDPVNLAAYSRKQPDCGIPSHVSITEISDVSGRSRGDGNQPSASLPHCAVQTVSADIKDRGISSASMQSPAYQGTHSLIRTLAAVSSPLTQQTTAHKHTAGVTHNVRTSYQSANWRPVLSPRTAQLVASAVSTAGRALNTDSTVKEAEHNPLLLQLQTAQLQALLRGFPSSSSVQCQSAVSLATQRRQFACNICGKMLSSQHNLRLHEATIHRGLFQFHCPICNKGLRQERDLRGHLANRHDWKKEFCCSICGHEFGYKRNLKHHVMSHHGRSSLAE